LLKELDATLRVVLALDLLVVRERCVLGGMMEELEAVFGVSASAEVLDFNCVGLVFPVGGALTSGGIRADAASWL